MISQAVIALEAFVQMVSNPLPLLTKEKFMIGKFFFLLSLSKPEIAVPCVTFKTVFLASTVLIFNEDFK
jgi:hypothetical protein